MYYVFIVYNKKNELSNIGVTIDMSRRMQLLKFQKKKYCKVVYYEEYEDSKEATERENELNYLSKELIHELVTENNPMLIDLLKNVNLK